MAADADNMSGPVQVAPGRSLPHRLFVRLTSAMNSLGTVWIFGLMFLIVADVGGRWLLNSPIRGVNEIVSLSIVGCVFLQLANTLHVGRMTRADVFIGWLDRTRPFAAAWYRLVFDLCGALVFFLIAKGTWPVAVRAWREGEFVGVEGDFTAPVWPVKWIIVVGSSAMFIEFVFRIVGSLAVIAGRPAPAGLPGGAPPPRKLGAILLLAVVMAAGAAVFAAGLPRTGIGVASILVMLVLIYAGMHIGTALVLLSYLGITMLKGSTVLAVKTLALASSGAISSYLFGVVPLFVLMGLLVNVSGLGRDTFDVAQWLVGRIRGGLGVATVAANAVFAAITGVSIASAAVFTKVAVPEMVRHGYTVKFAVGVVAGSSVLGMLIPPSLLLIIYGVVAEQSVGKLFIAAALPGIILAIVFSIAIVVMARLWPDYVGRPDEGGAQRVRLGIGEAAGKLVPVALLVALVLGGIYGGVFTPTEAGAMGAFGALVIALAKRRLGWASLWRVLVETGHVAVSILFLIIAASIYSRMLTLTGIPGAIGDFMAGSGLGLHGFLLVYFVIVILLGMILDSTSIMLILLPLVLPVVTAFGGDLIWFGIFTVISVEIGLLTPPLGITVYVVKATLDDQSVKLNDIFAGAFPFVVIMILVALLIMAVPSISTVFL